MSQLKVIETSRRAVVLTYFVSDNDHARLTFEFKMFSHDVNPL